MSKIAVYDSYLKMIKNAVGTEMFRNLYLRKDGKKFDATEDGELSCAFFVSNLLLIWGLISEGHATVEGTIKDMEERGWRKVLLKNIKPGDVIIWEENGRRHFHNGFYIGNKKAVSNDSRKGVPKIHHWTYNNRRKIIAVYRYSRFR